CCPSAILRTSCVMRIEQNFADQKAVGYPMVLGFAYQGVQVCGDNARRRGHPPQLTVHGIPTIEAFSTTRGCGSIALISCLSRCNTAAGLIARGNKVECFAGCSR